MLRRMSTVPAATPTSIKMPDVALVLPWVGKGLDGGVSVINIIINNSIQYERKDLRIIQGKHKERK